MNGISYQKYVWSSHGAEVPAARYKATATELFFAVQWETLKRSLGLNDQFFPIFAAWAGARIRF